MMDTLHFSLFAFMDCDFGRVRDNRSEIAVMLEGKHIAWMPMEMAAEIIFGNLNPYKE